MAIQRSVGRLDVGTIQVESILGGRTARGNAEVIKRAVIQAKQSQVVSDGDIIFHRIAVQCLQLIIARGMIKVLQKRAQRSGFFMVGTTRCSIVLASHVCDVEVIVVQRISRDCSWLIVAKINRVCPMRLLW